MIIPEKTNPMELLNNAIVSAKNNGFGCNVEEEGNKLSVSINNQTLRFDKNVPGIYQARYFIKEQSLELKQAMHKLFTAIEMMQSQNADAITITPLDPVGNQFKIELTGIYQPTYEHTEVESITGEKMDMIDKVTEKEVIFSPVTIILPDTPRFSPQSLSSAKLDELSADIANRTYYMEDHHITAAVQNTENIIAQTKNSLDFWTTRKEEWIPEILERKSIDEMPIDKLEAAVFQSLTDFHDYFDNLEIALSEREE